MDMKRVENVLSVAIGTRDLRPLRSVRSGTKGQGRAPPSFRGSPKKNREPLGKRSHVSSREELEKVVQKDERMRALFPSCKQRAREPMD